MTERFERYYRNVLDDTQAMDDALEFGNLPPQRKETAPFDGVRTYDVYSTTQRATGGEDATYDEQISEDSNNSEDNEVEEDGDVVPDHNQPDSGNMSETGQRMSEIKSAMSAFRQLTVLERGRKLFGDGVADSGGRFYSGLMHAISLHLPDILDPDMPDPLEMFDQSLHTNYWYDVMRTDFRIPEDNLYLGNDPAAFTKAFPTKLVTTRWVDEIFTGFPARAPKMYFVLRRAFERSGASWVDHPLVRLMATILFGPGVTVSESSRPYYFRETSRGDVVFNPEVREAVDKGEWPLEYADCRVTDPGLLPVVWKMIMFEFTKSLDLPPLTGGSLDVLKGFQRVSREVIPGPMGGYVAECQGWEFDPDAELPRARFFLTEEELSARGGAMWNDVFEGDFAYDPRWAVFDALMYQLGDLYHRWRVVKKENTAPVAFMETKSPPLSFPTFTAHVKGGKPDPYTAAPHGYADFSPYDPVLFSILKEDMPKGNDDFPEWSGMCQSMPYVDVDRGEVYNIIGAIHSVRALGSGYTRMDPVTALKDQLRKFSDTADLGNHPMMTITVENTWDVRVPDPKACNKQHCPLCGYVEVAEEQTVKGVKLKPQAFRWEGFIRAATGLLKDTSSGDKATVVLTDGKREYEVNSGSKSVVGFMKLKEGISKSNATPGPEDIRVAVRSDLGRDGRLVAAVKWWILLLEVMADTALSEAQAADTKFASRSGDRRTANVAGAVLTTMMAGDRAHGLKRMVVSLDVSGMDGATRTWILAAILYGTIRGLCRMLPMNPTGFGPDTGWVDTEYVIQRDNGLSETYPMPAQAHMAWVAGYKEMNLILHAGSKAFGEASVNMFWSPSGMLRTLKVHSITQENLVRIINDRIAALGAQVISQNGTGDDVVIVVEWLEEPDEDGIRQVLDIITEVYASNGMTINAKGGVSRTGDVDYVKEQHYGSQKSPRLFRLRPAIGERSGFHQGARTTVILEIIDVLKEMVGRGASEVWCSRFAQYLNILGDTSAIFNSRPALDIDPARVLTTEVENDGVKQHRLRVFNAGFLSVPRSLGGAGRVPGTLLPSNSDAVNAAMLGGDWSDGLDRRGRLPLESLIHLSLIIPKADPLTLPFGYEGAAQDYLKAGFNVVVAGRHPVIDGYILDVSGGVDDVIMGVDVVSAPKEGEDPAFDVGGVLFPDRAVGSAAGGVALVLQSRQAMNTTGLFSETGVDVTTLFDIDSMQPYQARDTALAIAADLAAAGIPVTDLELSRVAGRPIHALDWLLKTGQVRIRGGLDRVRLAWAGAGCPSIFTSVPELVIQGHEVKKWLKGWRKRTMEEAQFLNNSDVREAELRLRQSRRRWTCCGLPFQRGGPGPLMTRFQGSETYTMWQRRLGSTSTRFRSP